MSTNDPMTKERLDAIRELVESMWNMDPHFLAAYAREHFPALLAEVERLRALTKGMARAWDEGRESGTTATMLNLSYGAIHQPANPYEQEEIK